MARLFSLIFTVIGAMQGYGQYALPEAVQNDYKKILLDEISSDLNRRFEIMDETILHLDKKTSVLDVAIENSRSAREEADRLKERLNYVEQKQSALDENETIIYEANYQAAIINLISMEREIKPLTLFNTTKDFISATTSAANPMTYSGYQLWYQKFSEYVEKEKGKEPILGILSHMLTLSGDASKNIPFSGPVTEPLFAGINSFIRSLGSGKKELREESQKMFLITAALAQWNYENEQIEKEWKEITRELESLQKTYVQLVKVNMQMMNLNQSDFSRNFCLEHDAHKRYSYLTSLKETCAVYVRKEKLTQPKQWKEHIYFQMMDIQELKFRFGMITSKIKDNIDRYEVLINRFRNDPYIGSRIASLEPKLTELSDIFDRTFEPTDYITSASRMYRVQ
jgi:cell division septum initiation protein DivIVA